MSAVRLRDVVAFGLWRMLTATWQSVHNFRLLACKWHAQAFLHTATARTRIEQHAHTLHGIWTLSDTSVRHAASVWQKRSQCARATFLCRRTNEQMLSWTTPCPSTLTLTFRLLVRAPLSCFRDLCAMLPPCRANLTAHFCYAYCSLALSLSPTQCRCHRRSVRRSDVGPCVCKACASS